jgi:Beige/BEACH domain/WD domain, G-beta repeat
VLFNKSKFTELWKKRKISNFDYLMALNRMAGRSFNDLTQYPVFPWILTNYLSPTIDLKDSSIYRDFSKPIGALNSIRLEQLLERYNELELFGFTEAEKFIYGSHYSSPGTVLHYLIRQEPFTTMAIDLQSGRFDCADRLFFDVAESWKSCLISTSDVKELIPEFFCLPELFLNTNQFPLGRTQTGKVLGDVSLPPWAKGSAFEFVRINRLALESDYVSDNLHEWVDLIFGYKQRGPQALSSHNLFHHLSYEGSVDLSKITDDVDRNAAESHIQNFGQTPTQLITDDPHPQRYSRENCWKPILTSESSEKNFRCYTTLNQYPNKRGDFAKGCILKLHVFSDFVLAVYADFTLGTYKWFPNNKSNRLRVDKIRPFARRELSASRFAMKRGSVVSSELIDKSCYATGNWSIGVTLGGFSKEVMRRNALLSSGRLMSGNEISLASAESSALIISCGYWDDCIKAHNVDTSRILASESGGHRGPIRCLAIGQDGALMATGGQDGTVRVWVVDHPDMSIALSDGYVQTSLGGSIESEILSCCHCLWGHTTPITSVALDSGLDVVASGCEMGLVCIHTLRRGEFVRSFQPPALSKDVPAGSVKIIAMGTEGTVVVHMEDMGLHTYTINAVCLCSTSAGETIHDMKLCSMDEILITGGDRCQVLFRRSYDLQTITCIDLVRHGPIRCITLTPNDIHPIEQCIFVGSDDGMITIIDEDPVHIRKDDSAAMF